MPAGFPFRAAHAYAERELGPEHPKTLRTLNNLADGRYWIERNDLRILQTGRDLTREPLHAGSDTLLALGASTLPKRRRKAATS